MKINQFAIATVATLLIGSSLVAQQTPANSTSQASSNTPQQAANSLTKDQTFAQCLAIVDQEQVTLCRFAQGKATKDEVKQLAATLEKAHQGCLEHSRVFPRRLAVPATPPPRLRRRPSIILQALISFNCIKRFQPNA
jgi:hypothetical protein